MFCVAGLAHIAIGASIPPVQLFANAFSALSPFRSDSLPCRLSTISVALLVTVSLCLLLFSLHLSPIAEIRQDTVFQCRSALYSANKLISQVKPFSVRPFATHHSHSSTVLAGSLFLSLFFKPTI